MKQILQTFSFICLLATVIVACYDHEQTNERLPLNKEGLVRTRAMNFEATDYCWGNGEKTTFQRMDGKYYVVFNSAVENRLKSELAKTGIELVHIEERKDYSAYSYSWDMTGSGAKRFVDYKTAIIEDSYERMATALSSALYWSPYYRDENGNEVGITEQFFVKLKPKTELTQIAKLAEENSVEMIGANIHLPGWYLLACTSLSKGNSLEMANLFYDSNLFDEAHPDIIYESHLNCISEPWYNNGVLWHLGNNSTNQNIHVNYCNARSIIPMASSNITVAVLEKYGIQTDHPDLYNVLSGWDSNSGTSPSIVGTDPRHLDHIHAPIIAGFIGGIPNGDGVAGIACGVKILPISTLGTVSSNKEHLSFNYAVNNGAHVISYSQLIVGYIPPLLQAAVLNAVTNGRGGKGCVMVCGAGNTGDNYLEFPANLADVITVGGIDKSGSKSSWSSYGSTLDIVAPNEELSSTSVNGTYNNNAYGTSYAVPQVAATAALILSINPNLTRKQVTDIIERTAYKNLPGHTFTNLAGRPNGTYNSQVGYGLLDSYMAVYYAEQRISGPDVIGASCSATYTLSPAPLGATNISWQVVGGGLTPPSGLGISCTVGRTSDLNDPVNTTIRFSFDIRNQTYTMDKNIIARIEPVIRAGVHDVSAKLQRATAQVGKPCCFKAAIPSDQGIFVQQYQWELYVNGVKHNFTGETTQSFTFTQAGTFQLRLRILDGCQWSKWIDTYIDVL